MKKSFRLLYLFTWASILWGCTPDLVDPLPKLELTQTKIPTTALSTNVTTLSELPVTCTPLPNTTIPLPSSTLPIPTTTTTPSLGEKQPEPCQPGEFDAYYNEWVLISNQVFVMATESQKLGKLPNTRAEEILVKTNQIRTIIELMTAPPCMENTHQQTLDALNYLERGINALLEDDFVKAKYELNGAFMALSWASVDVGYLSTRETETHAPSQ